MGKSGGRTRRMEASCTKWTVQNAWTRVRVCCKSHLRRHLSLRCIMSRPWALRRRPKGSCAYLFPDKTTFTVHDSLAFNLLRMVCLKLGWTLRVYFFKIIGRYFRCRLNPNALVLHLTLKASKAHGKTRYTKPTFISEIRQSFSLQR